MADGLLLLHAFPLDAWMWTPQLEALGDDVPIVSPNFPGFGGASLAGPVMTMDAAAERAAGAASEGGLARVVLCGVSMGGYVAFAFWRRYRDRVAGLVLANTRAGADDEAGKERRRALAARLLEEGNGFLVESPPPLLSPNAPDELWRQVKEDIRAQPAEGIAAASLGMAERADSTPDLAAIDVPTLVITSSEDSLIPPEGTKPIADHVPGARFEVIEGAGHLSNLEREDAFNDLLRGHLEVCGFVKS